MDKLAVVKNIMEEFSSRTCISGAGCTPKRYLWTDVFAVCNFLELFRRTGEEHYKEEALQLVYQVHHVLGRHRSDDSRSGWISGLDEEEGEVHPTIGGLRIGKKLNERKKDEPQDEHLEWEQDGQYFHYLTKWMHALHLVTEETHDPKYSRWALELAKTAYEKFSHQTYAGARRMYWKMSIDLSYPLVSSMGQHDALDGYVTYLLLKKDASVNAALSGESNIDSEMKGLYAMARQMSMTTDDALGIGGLLSDATLLVQMELTDEMSELLVSMLHAAREGLLRFMASLTLRYPAQYRLAFRELGLSIGLHGVRKMLKILEADERMFSNRGSVETVLKELASYLPLCEYIESFWLASENQSSSTWQEHMDINAVMLATSLMPSGFLRI